MATPPVEPDPLASDIAMRSDWWPQYVELTRAVTPEGTDSEFRNGQRGVLIRVEPSGVLVDFGRNGIFRIPVAATDLLEQAQLVRNAGKPEMGLFSRSIYNKFFQIEEGKARQCRAKDFRGSRYFLLIYTDVGSDTCEGARKAIERFLEEGSDSPDDLGVLVIPSDPNESELIDDLKTSGVRWPTMYHFLSRSYLNVFQHHPVGDLTAVLMDDNGRVLDQTSSAKEGKTLETLLSAISGQLKTDRLRRFVP